MITFVVFIFVCTDCGALGSRDSVGEETGKDEALYNHRMHLLKQLYVFSLRNDPSLKFIVVDFRNGIDGYKYTYDDKIEMSSERYQRTNWEDVSERYHKERDRYRMRSRVSNDDLRVRKDQPEQLPLNLKTYQNTIHGNPYRRLPPAPTRATTHVTAGVASPRSAPPPDAADGLRAAAGPSPRRLPPTSGSRSGTPGRPSPSAAPPRETSVEEPNAEYNQALYEHRMDVLRKYYELHVKLNPSDKVITIMDRNNIHAYHYAGGDVPDSLSLWYRDINWKELDKQFLYVYRIHILREYYELYRKKTLRVEIHLYSWRIEWEGIITDSLVKMCHI